MIVYVVLMVHPATLCPTSHAYLCMSWAFPPLLATVLCYVFIKLHNITSSTPHVPPTPRRTSTQERMFQFMDCHLSITSIPKYFTNAVEYGITSLLHTRAACERKSKHQWIMTLVWGVAIGVLLKSKVFSNVV